MVAKKEDDPPQAMPVRMAIAETDIHWIKQRIQSIDNKLWALLVLVLGGVASGLILRFLGH